MMKISVSMMMKKIMILILAVFVFYSLQVAAKGGSSGSSSSSGSSGSQHSGGAGHFNVSSTGLENGKAENGPQDSGDNAPNGAEEKGRRSYQDSLVDLEQEIDALRIRQNFRTRLIEQLHTRLEQECNEAIENGGEIDRVRTREIVGIARQSESKALSPEETAGICAAYQGTVWAGIRNRFGEALATEGLNQNQSPEQVENTLRMTARLRHEFGYPLLAGDSEGDGEGAEELGRKLAAYCHLEDLEVRLRQALRNGASLEEAVDRLAVD